MTGDTPYNSEGWDVSALVHVSLRRSVLLAGTMSGPQGVIIGVAGSVAEQPFPAAHITKGRSMM